MSDVMQQAQEFIQSLTRQRAAYLKYSRQEVAALFKPRDDQLPRRVPRPFHASSFLYLRSFEGDTGTRPLGHPVFWLSPDLRLSPASSPASFTETLHVGETYTLHALLRNRGDLAVPSANVELWLTNPTLGFDTRFATHLTAGRVPTAWVPSQATGEIRFEYTVPPGQEGHKCLFARAFSFSPLELPLHDFLLDPTVDRRVAQHNLHIVHQNQPFVFEWIHPANTRQQLTFSVLERDEVLALRHPVLAQVKPARELRRKDWERLTEVALAEAGVDRIEISPARHGLILQTGDPEGGDADTLQRLFAEVQRVLKAVAAGEVHLADHSALLREFRNISGDQRRSVFRMRVPDLGVQPGQVTGVHLTTAHSGREGGRPQGGMTLLILA